MGLIESFPTEVVELAQAAAGAEELRPTLISTHWPEDLANELPPARQVRIEGTAPWRTVIAGVQGLAFEVSSASLQDLVLDFAPRLRHLGATIYGLGPQRNLHEISGTEDRHTEVQLTDQATRVWAIVIPARDPYEPLRVERPGSADLPFPDLIRVFRDWERICSFEILSAGSRDVEIVFRKFPSDLGAFVKRVIKISPGAMNGVYLGEPMDGWEPIDYIRATDDQTPSDLARNLQRTRRLYMFWD